MSDTMRAIDEMTTEVRELNIKNGWRLVTTTFGDRIALLHSEVSEALEAYRSWRLADATEESGKPEGVGSEYADIFIRLLDMCDIDGINLVEEYERKMAYNHTRPFRHGGRAL